MFIGGKRVDAPGRIAWRVPTGLPRLSKCLCALPWRAYFYLGLALALGLSPAIAARLHPVDASAFLRQGDAATRDGNTPAAIEAYQKAVDADPQALGGYVSLIAAYHEAWYESAGLSETQRRACYEDIVETYRKACVVAPKDLQLAFGYAMTLTCAEYYGVPPDWNAAREAWRQCLVLGQAGAACTDSNNPAASITPLLYLARIEMREDAPHAARNYLEAALALDPESGLARRMLSQLQ